MDLFLSLQLLLLVIFLTALSLIFYKRNPSGRHKLPPGKLGWPMIGETLEFLSTGQKGCPEKFLNDRMKKNSTQIFKTSIAGQKVAVLCGPSGNKLLFSNENKLVAPWWPPTFEKIFMTKKPSSSTVTYGKIIRSLLREILKPESLKHYVPIMDRMAKQHLETDWLPYNQVQVLPLSKKLTFSLVCRLFMSVEDPAHVTKLSNRLNQLLPGLLSLPIDFPGTNYNRAIKAANHIRQEICTIIKQRRSQLSEGITDKEELGTPQAQDLLSKILIASNEDVEFISEAMMADIILSLLVASHDTTSTTITFLVYYLADHPDVYARVLKEQREIADGKGPKELLNWEDIAKMKYSRNVIHEVLRLAPPGPGTFRQAITDINYAGFCIPKGWKTYWSVHTTHKNPEYFPDPERFDPSRFEGAGPMPFTFTPFGGGPSMCPGSEFARLEVLTLMHNLVLQFKWEKLIPDEKVIFDPSPRPANNLPIKLLPRV